VGHLWGRYIEIATGLDKVTFADIHAYQSVMGVKLTPLEVRAIIKIDNERRKND
jgi:hypothetical protein